jgi:ferredoxin
MAPRGDEGERQLINVINPKLCVSCGVCIGGCSFCGPPERSNLSDPALNPPSVVLLNQAVTLAPRQILPLQIRDAHLGGDLVAGEKLFNETRRGAGTAAASAIRSSLESSWSDRHWPALARGAATRVPA